MKKKQENELRLSKNELVELNKHDWIGDLHSLQKKLDLVNELEELEKVLGEPK